MRALRALMVAALAAGPVVVAGVPVAAAGSRPYCGIVWGSLAKSAPAMSGAPVTGARVGRHPCFDRLVIDLGGMPVAGYHVRYTDGLVNEDTGERVPVAGGATLMVTVRAPSHDADGSSTVPWRWATHVVTPEQFGAGGFRTLRDLVSAGTFEGQTTLALGVRARLPFRVFTLAGPGSGSRVVVDVAHRWQ